MRATLAEQLLEVFNTCGHLTDTEKQVNVIEFFRAAMLTTGLKTHEVMSGKLHEILLAGEIGAKMNTKMQGPDMVIPATATAVAIPIELKKSDSSLGTKCNVNFSPPKKKAGVTVAEYDKLVLDKFKEKGDIVVRHFFSDDVKVFNEYKFNHEFIARLIIYKNSSGGERDRKVNIGGVSCRQCTLVSRLIYYVKLNKLFMEDKDFDFSLVDNQVPLCKCLRK